MNMTAATLHRRTPVLSELDPRGAVIASIGLCRRSVIDPPEKRISRSAFDAAGRLVASWDPRLWADGAPANLTAVHSLSGQVLASESTDSGWRIMLPGMGGQILMSWDGRDTVRRVEYDKKLRPTAVFEDESCVERLQYGTSVLSTHNQCGQVIRHDDPAGTCLNAEFEITGSVLEQTRHFLQGIGIPDWPEAVGQRCALCEPGGGATTGWGYNALGEVIKQTDAVGNIQVLAHTVAGQLKEARLQLKGEAERTLIRDIHYDAQGRIESETADNSVVSTARYCGEDGRLLSLKSAKGSDEPLQNLLYDYDPVGNVIRIEDRAQPVRYFANQRIEAVSTYQYDTLYQLIEATGREAAMGSRGPAAPGFQSPPDPSQLSNYTQIYHYDAGGNLRQLVHSGSQSHSRTLMTAGHGNRSLPVVDDQIPDEQDIAAAFDANGNLRQLRAGQALSWDRRNQLQQVNPVVREAGIDDSERYVYDASGQRLRKVRTTQARAVTHTAEVRYLPGLEIRTNTATGETLHVIIAQAGRSSVRALHWPSDAVKKDQIRYTLADHLGSCTIELDETAQLISQESYYPFGETSWWAGRDAIEANYKTARYSGKERDATGLYYYGLRYYAPWLQRWINPDPAGTVDGLNLFCFAKNRVCSGVDLQGTVYQGMNDSFEKNATKTYAIKYRGIEEMERAGEHALVFTLDMAIEEGLSGMRKAVSRLASGDVTGLEAFVGAEALAKQGESNVFVSGVIAGYTSIISALSQYQRGGARRDQLVYLEGDAYGPPVSEYAFVFPEDTHKRIFFTAEFRANSLVAKMSTLIHELSHLELNTNDDFYYPAFDMDYTLSSEQATGYQRAVVREAIQQNSELKATYQSWKHRFSKFETWLTRVADFWGTYIVTQMHDDKAGEMHGLSIDRFNVLANRPNSSSSNRSVPSRAS
ncbi:RHS repeat protein [Pseudomonas sp. CDFA 602]|uniref:RHS repeat-associated core domain-containing protein n=1 Tax=Pseudomonas californiensis TaxID=2829823 RepID=UPI001E317108|nr:RHS repeat-associated core domain-containing protein [Pseudomonas californiensis]MCD5994012.1 RHS repeat protein [Pseudomonas californiensis]MCD5999485.1 RHS repeat protein [Pseudomonas californiensis]